MDAGPPTVVTVTKEILIVRRDDGEGERLLGELPIRVSGVLDGDRKDEEALAIAWVSYPVRQHEPASKLGFLESEHDLLSRFAEHVLGADLAVVAGHLHGALF